MYEGVNVSGRGEMGMNISNLMSYESSLVKQRSPHQTTYIQSSLYHLTLPFVTKCKMYKESKSLGYRNI